MADSPASVTEPDPNALRQEHECAAGRALAHWNLRVREVARVSVSENIAFRVLDADGRCFVLRLHRPGYHSREELLSERIWTAALAASGVRVPVAVPTRREGHFVRVPVAGERRYAGLLEWVEGTMLAQAIAESDARASTTAHFQALGELMAAMHSQAVGWRSPSGFRRHALDADGLMGEQPFWGRFWESPYLDPAENRRLETLRHPIHDILARQSKTDGAYSLIHADLHPGNVVVDGASLHVIDFDDAGFGWHAYEFAVALHAYRASPAYAILRDALLAGYRRRRAFDDEHLRLLPLFGLIRSLASIGWTASRPEHEHGGRTAALMRDVDQSAERILADCR